MLPIFSVHCGQLNAQLNELYQNFSVKLVRAVRSNRTNFDFFFHSIYNIYYEQYF